MLTCERHSWRQRAAAVALVGTLAVMVAPLSIAQFAPVDGAHHAASSGTGFQSAVNSMGGYSASVPLDLPAARGDVPVPVDVVYGGNQVGAAGLGWDVPLSFLVRSTTTAHRRPAPQAFSVDQPPALIAPERVSLTLNGSTTNLVRNASNTAWVAQRGSAQIEVRDLGNGTMVMYDGEGRTYNFSSKGATSGSRLLDGNFYLLTSIVGASSVNRVDLAYSITSPTLPSGGSGLAINLANVSYNQSPTTAGCFKHRVYLSYDSPVVAPTPPLSLSFLNGAAFVRTQKLTAITVKSKDTCGASEKIVSNYSFAYQADIDTRQPRLQTVTMTGRQGTAEASVSLPVASYSYGSIVDPATGRITYQRVASAGPTDDPDDSPYQYGIAFSLTADAQVTTTITDQFVADVNGDNRLDFVHGSITYLNYAGSASSGHPIVFQGQGPAPVWSPQKQELYASSMQFKSYVDKSYDSRVETYDQHIDINGDGRLDLISSHNEVLGNTVDIPGWFIHVTTPDPQDGSKSVLKKIRVSDTSVRTALRSVGLLPAASTASDLRAVPFSATVTLPESAFAVCWTVEYAYGDWHWVRTDVTKCTDFPTAVNSRKRTITLFELRDINGDGYPDFVYGASRVNNVGDVPPPSGPVPQQLGVYVVTTLPSDIRGSRDVKALINTAGVHIGDTGSMFSSPITLEAGGSNGCGLARWEVDPNDVTGGKVNQICGFQDVNGDGIVDRVTTSSSGQTIAKLGTGDMARPYLDGVQITLPGPIARTETTLVTKGGNPYEYVSAECSVPPAETFHTYSTRVLRDINGDGVPDYLRSQSPTVGNTWKVSMGTGTGFSSEVDVDVGRENFSAISIEEGRCVQESLRWSRSATTSGLYELDGDGQPEFLGRGNGTNGWDVYQLKAPVQQLDVGTSVASVPAAGHLVRIDNGYGASTTIGYRSVKADNHSLHYTPYPEIVVAAVGTRDSSGTPLLSTTKYAYGGAEMIFDPAYDAFRFPGYRRSVSLTSAGEASAPSEGTATIVDSYPLDAFATGMDATARFKRYSKVGLSRDVVTLSGNVGTDPWELLTVDVNRDSRRMAGVHYDWDARLLTAGIAPNGNERCIDMMYPYDFAASKNAALSSTEDVCTQHGFVFQTNTFSWRGTPGSGDPLSSTNTVQVNTEVTAVDDFGRVTAVTYDNDLARSGDDLCVQTVYATPTGANQRVLNAPASRTVNNCGTTPITLNKEWFEYDTTATGTKLGQGQIANGLLTAHIVARLDPATGAPIDSTKPNIRLFDAIYDTATANPVSVTLTRDDNATRTTTTTYDPFGLVAVGSTITAKNADGSTVPTQTIAATIDPTTLNVLSATDPNGASSGKTYDGFGRVLLSKVTPKGGTEGVMSSVTYNGFAAGQTAGRSIVQKVFSDPVAVANVGTTPGRIGTVFLDSLGREQRTEVALGADYANKKLVAGQRIYDALGRVRFEADPFLSTEAFASSYGTTQHFNADGSPQCTYRAYGLQARVTDLNSAATRSDESQERYVSCQWHAFVNNQEAIYTQNADARLDGSRQTRVRQGSLYSAIGQLIQRRTDALAGGDAPDGPGGLASELMDFTYDALGNAVSMTRFQDPRFVTNPLTTRWRYDSLGRVMQFEAPGNAVQNRSYSSWGELTLVQWNDPTITTSGGNDRRSLSTYDALGRLTHREDRTKNIVDAETVYDYVYDQGEDTVTPPVTATNVLGRLSKAISPTSKVALSYDGLGRVYAATYTDTTVSPAKVYVEKHDVRGDGTVSSLHLLMPDNAFKDERVDYAYDSAGRTRSVKYNDGTNRDLFLANGTNDIDVLGRIRRANYGLAVYTANYAEAGRRLLNSVKVASPAPATTSREIAFPVIPGTAASVAAFDPMSRERARRESKDGMASPFAITRTYDFLGRLEASSKWNMSSSQGSVDRDYAYDLLGNVTTQNDRTSGQPGSVALTYQTTDFDRICSVGYSGTAAPMSCNVKYDGVGNIVEMPTRAGTARRMTYLANGRTKTIVDGSTNASFAYDAFGAVQQLVLTSGSSSDTRRDKHFGGMITQRDEGGVSVLTRTIPGPGLIATRHGPAGGWTFTFGEERGTRFVTDQNGMFVQDIDYQPYGETKNASGASPGTANYTSAQWNGGDALAALGVSQLGARMYDPVIGRFLSRDPLLLPRTAATTNPYAFANNDPVNSSDPSGLCTGPECPPDPICWFCPQSDPGGGGGGGGGQPGHNNDDGTWEHPAPPQSKPQGHNNTWSQNTFGHGARATHPAVGPLQSILNYTLPNTSRTVEPPLVPYIPSEDVTSYPEAVASYPDDPWCYECVDTPYSDIRDRQGHAIDLNKKPIVDYTIDGDAIDRWSNEHGDEADVVAWILGQSGAGGAGPHYVKAFGIFTDVIQNGSSVVKFIADPSLETSADVYINAVDTHLMNMGPAGWVAAMGWRHAFKTIKTAKPDIPLGDFEEANMRQMRHKL